MVGKGGEMIHKGARWGNGEGYEEEMEGRRNWKDGVGSRMVG